MSTTLLASSRDWSVTNQWSRILSPTLTIVSKIGYASMPLLHADPSVKILEDRSSLTMTRERLRNRAKMYGRIHNVSRSFQSAACVPDHWYGGQAEFAYERKMSWLSTRLTSSPSIRGWRFLGRRKAFLSELSWIHVEVPILSALKEEDENVLKFLGYLSSYVMYGSLHYTLIALRNPCRLDSQ